MFSDINNKDENVWFELTGNKKRVLEQTVYEFKYTENVLDKKAGDIGGFVADPNCFKTRFSSTNSCFLRGIQIMQPCTIVNSELDANTVVDACYLITGCHLKNVTLVSHAKGRNETNKKLELIDTIISGSDKYSIPIYSYEKSTVKIESSRIFSDFTDFASKGQIFVGANCRLFAKKCSVSLKDNEIVVRDCGKLRMNNATVSGNIHLVSSNHLFPDVRLSDSLVAGEIYGRQISLSSSSVFGRVTSLRNSGNIVLKESILYDSAVIASDENSGKLSIVRCFLYDNANITSRSVAGDVFVCSSKMSGHSKLSFTAGSHDVESLTMLNNACVLNSSLFDVQIQDNAIVASTEIHKSVILGDAKIGYCRDQLVEPSIFNETCFKNIHVKDKFDFFVFPVLHDSYYYIYTSGNVYRLFTCAPVVKFQKINLDDEIDFCKSFLKKNNNKSILISKIINHEKIISNSVEYMKENAFDKRKFNFEELNDFARRTIYFSVFKMLFATSYPDFVSKESNEQVKKAEKFFASHTTVDIVNRTLVCIDHNIVVFPEFTLLDLKTKDFKKSFFQKAKKTNFFIV